MCALRGAAAVPIRRKNFGRLDVSVNGSWASVCSPATDADPAGRAFAMVACRQVSSRSPGLHSLFAFRAAVPPDSYCCWLCFEPCVQLGLGAGRLLRGLSLYPGGELAVMISLPLTAQSRYERFGAGAIASCFVVSRSLEFWQRCVWFWLFGSPTSLPPPQDVSQCGPLTAAPPSCAHLEDVGVDCELAPVPAVFARDGLDQGQAHCTPGGVRNGSAAELVAPSSRDSGSGAVFV